MNSKYQGHTPGPWRFISGSQRVGSGTWGCVADIAGTVTAPEMRAANGHLIADAPALLARVERLEAALIGVAMIDHLEDHSDICWCVRRKPSEPHQAHCLFARAVLADKS